MANEDSRENSVMKGALELAAIGATAYGVYRGGRGLIKNYDDLGSTFLGKAGDKMTKGINKGISALEGKAGGNKVKDSLDTVQDKILDSDFKKSMKKIDKDLSKDGLEMSQENVDDIHKTYKSNSNASEKREDLKDLSDLKKQMQEERKEFLKDNPDGSYRKELLKNNIGDTPSFVNQGGREVRRSRKDAATSKL